MAIGNKKSKMGPMLAVDLNSIQQSQAEPMSVEEAKQPEAKPVKKESAPAPATPTHESTVKTPPSVGGRPKFELISGMPEKKVNFHCPEALFWAINREATNQHITNKQLICEMLLEVMTTKYGFKLK